MFLLFWLSSSDLLLSSVLLMFIFQIRVVVVVVKFSLVVQFSLVDVDLPDSYSCCCGCQVQTC